VDTATGIKMGFTSTAWTKLKTMNLTLSDWVNTLNDNVNSLFQGLVRPRLVRSKPFGERTDRDRGGAFTKTFYRGLYAFSPGFPTIELDITHDYRQRFIELRGFFAYQNLLSGSGNLDRLPGGAERAWVGRYKYIYEDLNPVFTPSQPIFRRNISPIKTSGLIDDDDNYEPKIDPYVPYPESRIMKCFFSGGGLNSAPKPFDMFTYEVELPLVVIKSEDTSTAGVEILDPNSDPIKVTPIALEGAYIIIYARQSDGALMVTLINHKDIVENRSNLTIDGTPSASPPVIFNICLDVTALQQYRETR